MRRLLLAITLLLVGCDSDNTAPPSVWECACREGYIERVLCAYSYDEAEDLAMERTCQVYTPEEWHAAGFYGDPCWETDRECVVQD